MSHKLNLFKMRLLSPNSRALLFSLLLTGNSYIGWSQPQTVDFRYAPPYWQSTICLPDDPYKTLVDEQGNLKIHPFPLNQYGEPRTLIGFEAAESVQWIGQHMESARIPIVITKKTWDGIDMSEEAFTVIRIPDQELQKAIPLPDEPDMNRGSGKEQPRNAILLVTLTNTGHHDRSLSPAIQITSSLPVDTVNGKLILNNRDQVNCSLPLDITSFEHSKTGARIRLKTFSLKQKQTISLAVFLFSGGAIAEWPQTVQEAITCKKEARSFWSSIDLPYDKITIPDPGIQHLIDASIRNIWQSREIKNGLPAFQVGPTCYRGLWIVDGAFILEAATILGTGNVARNGVLYNLSFQKEDGRFEVMDKYWKENGIITWTTIRHAMLTQDKKWLESVWPKLERTMEFIATLRKESYLDHTPLNDGLMPAGTIDGGLNFGQEYTNVYWNLLGIKAFIQAAHWLNKQEEAQQWEQIYADFYSTFAKAAERDKLVDPSGNRYLPVLMGKDTSNTLPQKAQWAFCQAVYPGQLFDREDPLVSGNLKMLEATEREGMVYGTGWNSTGLWNYFASFYGHAWLWQGNGQKAAETLYAFANHASPLLAWREEQSLKGEPFRKVGDMPHNWASAEFIRLTVHLLALDRGNELHLFEGLPAEWTRPGMITSLNGIATPFGPLTVKLTISKKGDRASLTILPLSDHTCKNIVVHTNNLTNNTIPINLDPSKTNHITLIRQ